MQIRRSFCMPVGFSAVSLFLRSAEYVTSVQYQTSGTPVEHPINSSKRCGLREITRERIIRWKREREWISILKKVWYNYRYFLVVYVPRDFFFYDSTSQQGDFSALWNTLYNQLIFVVCLCGMWRSGCSFSLFRVRIEGVFIFMNSGSWFFPKKWDF